MTRDPILGDFERLVRTRGDAVLVAAPAREATVSDVDRLAAGLRTKLAARRFEPGTLIGLAVPDGPAFLAGLVALRRAGLVPVLIDCSSPASERERIGSTLGAPTVLDCASAWPTGPDDWVLRPVTLDTRPVCLPRCGYVKLTSGSTGTPRGVATPAEALAADDEQLFRTMRFTESDRLLCLVPLAHSYGLASLAIPALRHGVPLILPDSGSPFAPLEAAARLGATLFPTTPAWLHSLVRLAEPPTWPERLRLTISAGAPLAPEVARRFRELFGRPVHTFYGSSESGGICYDQEGSAAERGTVGTPVHGARVELDPFEAGDPTHGIVTVRSRAVGDGYIPESDPRLGGGRFVAGDIGCWKGGELALTGRADDLINVRGKKVFPREVEHVLGQLPGVEDVVVIGVPVPGTGGHYVRAVLAVPEGTLSVDTVTQFARSRLAAHKVPRSVVILRAIPRTSRGKLDRRALLEPNLAG